MINKAILRGELDVQAWSVQTDCPLSFQQLWGQVFLRLELIIKPIAPSTIKTNGKSFFMLWIIRPK